MATRNSCAFCGARALALRSVLFFLFVVHVGNPSDIWHRFAFFTFARVHLTVGVQFMQAVSGLSSDLQPICCCVAALHGYVRWAWSCFDSMYSFVSDWRARIECSCGPLSCIRRLHHSRSALPFDLMILCCISCLGEQIQGFPIPPAVAG